MLLFLSFLGGVGGGGGSKDREKETQKGRTREVQKKVHKIRNIYPSPSAQIDTQN